MYTIISVVYPTCFWILNDQDKWFHQIIYPLIQCHLLASAFTLSAAKHVVILYTAAYTTEGWKKACFKSFTEDRKPLQWVIKTTDDISGILCISDSSEVSVLNPKDVKRQHSPQFQSVYPADIRKNGQEYPQTKEQLFLQAVCVLKSLSTLHQKVLFSLISNELI